MPFTLAIDLPNLPDGGALIIDGLGEFTNNETFEISDEDAALYQARKATIVSEYDEGGFLHSKLVDGPSLVETFKDHPHIKVTVVPVVPSKTGAPVITIPTAESAGSSDATPNS